MIKINRTIYWSMLLAIVWPIWKRIRYFKWAYQRVKYGFSDKDIWSLDYYLTGILARAIPKFIDGQSHPCLYDGENGEWTSKICRECNCVEKWNRNFRLGASLFQKLHDDLYEGEEWWKDQEKDYKEAMEWLKEHMENLWT